MSAVPTPSNNPTPATPSPLGVDPTPIAPVTPASPSSAGGNPPAAPATNQKTLSMEEFNSLQERAGRYDFIANDAELATKVVEHVKGKTGRIGTQPTNNQPVPQQSATQSVDPTVQQLLAENKQLAQRTARLEIENFKARHSDFDNVKDEMARVVNKYPGISIEDAYSLAKSAKPQSQQGSVRETPTTPTAETNRSVGNIAENNTLEEIERRINDRKSTPSFDQALDLAFAGAKLKAQQGE